MGDYLYSLDLITWKLKNYLCTSVARKKFVWGSNALWNRPLSFTSIVIFVKLLLSISNLKKTCTLHSSSELCVLTVHAFIPTASYWSPFFGLISSHKQFSPVWQNIIQTTIKRIKRRHKKIKKKREWHIGVHANEFRNRLLSSSEDEDRWKKVGE